MTLQANKDQFLHLIQHNKKLIFKVCNTYCADAEDRKDLVQEVIIQLWRSFEKYDNTYKLSTWMYRIALNTAISFYRSDNKRRSNTTSISENIIEIPNDDTSVELNEKITLLYQFIGQMNKLDKALMILYLDNNSYKDMADILGISETNVATKISRLKQYLKQQFTLQ
ncbi:RNA polymerase sigma factor [Mucilaginibacter gilvus]|uniref:Sigma-70 family RNA polymerase sigma factor n=1 Tax=Mucilaginibacter gilvus TaxID=2305909 RepID=A0A3S3X5I9_9SPHI|nr:sigma-70 family RNA polymerase sigma factor [Mucilaginibacter gilvus]RWY50997.1 sigma-70 family RNA polymerase sigma factor [Mucilaginibacter gilvus]